MKRKKRMTRKQMEEARLEVERLFLARGGRWTVTELIEEAKTNPKLHDYFEWDDKAAGHLYRIQQAQDLINSISDRVIEEITYEYTRKPPAVIVRDHTKDVHERGHVHLSAVRQRSQEASAIVMTKVNEAEAAAERAMHYVHRLGFKQRKTVTSRLQKVMKLCEEIRETL